jgi:hypothetical protein
VLFMAIGLEPALRRAMASAAAMLVPHSLGLTGGLPLLPQATELRQANAQTGWRLGSSAVGNAAQGAFAGLSAIRSMNAWARMLCDRAATTAS